MHTRTQVQEIITKAAGSPVTIFEHSNGGDCRHWSANIPAGMTIAEAQSIIRQCEQVAPWLAWSLRIDFQPRITACVNPWHGYRRNA
jgi:hypothetical protein